MFVLFCCFVTLCVHCSVYFFFLMIRRPPRSTRTDTLFPYTTLFRSMGTMASTLAHELNQPLTAIINCLAGCERALDQKQIDRRELRGALERARSSADRAAETVSRIRLMVKIGRASRRERVSQ